jgi:hypothetical protein
MTFQLYCNWKTWCRSAFLNPNHSATLLFTTNNFGASFSHFDQVLTLYIPLKISNDVLSSHIIIEFKINFAYISYICIFLKSSTTLYRIATRRLRGTVLYEICFYIIIKQQRHFHVVKMWKLHFAPSQSFVLVKTVWNHYSKYTWHSRWVTK